MFSKSFSKEISSKWENTISGQRKAKLAAKKAREEEEERIKQLKDIEEEEYRAAERRRVIEDGKFYPRWRGNLSSFLSKKENLQRKRSRQGLSRSAFVY